MTGVSSDLISENNTGSIEKKSSLYKPLFADSTESSGSSTNKNNYINSYPNPNNAQDRQFLTYEVKLMAMEKINKIIRLGSTNDLPSKSTLFDTTPNGPGDKLYD